ncbi:hypothetical protein N7492_004534 [Penicillium capsulatum]|uniref:TonB C-terminal domain-containing protein n=1 Tax=Penicillium capsulatum TaxID=69766 RepID=A0A9W9LQU7_9EURO|nr:hypothetical protein N7492_004534 [Penicillium capsulatum]
MDRVDRRGPRGGERLGGQGLSRATSVAVGVMIEHDGTLRTVRLEADKPESLCDAGATKAIRRAEQSAPSDGSRALQCVAYRVDPAAHDQPEGHS